MVDCCGIAASGSADGRARFRTQDGGISRIPFARRRGVLKQTIMERQLTESHAAAREAMRRQQELEAEITDGQTHGASSARRPQEMLTGRRPAQGRISRHARP